MVLRYRRPLIRVYRAGHMDARIWAHKGHIHACVCAPTGKVSMFTKASNGQLFFPIDSILKFRPSATGSKERIKILIIRNDKKCTKYALYNQI